MLGVQKGWELKNVGSTKMLGTQICWEHKNVGSSKMLGAQKCWEYKMMGVQNCWKMLGSQNCSRTILTSQPGDQNSFKYTESVISRLWSVHLNSVEDSLHFLFHCPLYKENRHELNVRAQLVIPNWERL